MGLAVVHDGLLVAVEGQRAQLVGDLFQTDREDGMEVGVVGGMEGSEGDEETKRDREETNNTLTI